MDETQDKLFSVLFVMCRDEELCNDIMQEAYIRLWQNIEVVKDDHAILALLKQYARNLFLDEMRKRSRQQSILVEIVTAEMAASPEEQAIDAEKHRQIQTAINKLPRQQQLIFRMHKEYAMSYRQIADELEIATGTIEKQMNRALKSLKHDLHHLKGTNTVIIVCITIPYWA